MPKLKISNATFLVIFKHCAPLQCFKSAFFVGLRSSHEPSYSRTTFGTCISGSRPEYFPCKPSFIHDFIITFIFFILLFRCVEFSGHFVCSAILVVKRKRAKFGVRNWNWKILVLLEISTNSIFCKAMVLKDIKSRRIDGAFRRKNLWKVDVDALISKKSLIVSQG